MNSWTGAGDSHTSTRTDQQNKATDEDEFAGQKLQRDELPGFDNFVRLDSLLKGDLNPNQVNGL